MDENEQNTNHDAKLHGYPLPGANPLPPFQQNSPQNDTGQQPPLQRNNPLLLRIHADDQDKKTICIFWTVLLIFILLLAILANVAVPNLYVAVQNSSVLAGTVLAGCDNPSAFSLNEVVCAPFSSNLAVGEMISGWGPANQVGLVYLQITPVNFSKPVSINQNYTLQSYTLTRSYSQTDRADHLQKTSLDASINTTISFSSDDATYLYASDGTTVVGYTYLLAAITKIQDDGPFLVRAIFTNSSDFQNVSHVALQSYAINPQFTYYTIIVRYVFFGLSIISLVLYLIRYCKIPADQRVFEQRMIAVMSVLLLMFNDPFYPLTVLKPNGGSAFFSLLFVVNLVVALILLWIVMADHIAFQDGLRTTEECTKKKIAYVAAIWVELMVSLMVYTMYQIQDVPLVPNDFLRKFKTAQVITALTVLLGFMYIVYRYCQVCNAPDSKLWRNSIFMVFSVIFIVALFIIIASNSLILFNYKGPSILLVYGLVNIYMYYLQYMYTITREESLKLEGGKDGNWGQGGVPEEDNYDVLTIGTIDIVDVNLDSPEKSRNERKSYELVQKQVESEIEVSKDKQPEFQSYEFD